MQYVDFIKLPNGDLRIKLLRGHKRDIKDIQKSIPGIISQFLEVIEYQLCTGWEEIKPEEIGALTSSIILSDDVTRDDSTDEITDIGNVWWFPDYMIKDEVQELLDKGYIDFTLGESYVEPELEEEKESTL